MKREIIIKDLERIDQEALKRLRSDEKILGMGRETFRTTMREAVKWLKPAGTFECFHCGERTLIWGGDHTFEDYGIEGEGIVQNLHCENCGADVMYYVSMEEDDEEEGQNEEDNDKV